MILGRRIGLPGHLADPPPGPPTHVPRGGGEGDRAWSTATLAERHKAACKERRPFGCGTEEGRHAIRDK